jgi:small subunit ribosomal protein S19e
MATLYDVPADELIDELADRFEDEDEVTKPEWAEFTKTGPAKELPPQDEDFWFVRTASLLRKVATKGPVGVERLATEYGANKAGTNRYRVATSRREAGSKKLIRLPLQQLEEAGYVETAKGEGRRVTDEGRSLLDEVAGDLLEELDRPELERYA